MQSVVPFEWKIIIVLFKLDFLQDWLLLANCCVDVLPILHSLRMCISIFLKRNVFLQRGRRPSAVK